MVLRQLRSLPHGLILLLLALGLISHVSASYGDKLPEFKHCVEICGKENCDNGKLATEIPLLHRLLLWDCPSECDYVCQHIITDMRVASSEPIVQFHGKWPFYRFLGMQEPFSVLFSLLNFLAHQQGLSKITSAIPATYPLRKYYEAFAYFGMTSWVFSMLFHTRDFNATEQLDYIAAGASVLYGFFYTPIRVFRLDQGGSRGESMVRAWGIICFLMFVGHVAYLKLWSWDYSYNMAANVTVGLTQNALWTWFSFNKYKKSGRPWAMLPSLVVVFLLMAMSLELLDFPPVYGCLDAHSLWHLATVFPTLIWYNFLITDSLDDMAGARLKN